MGRVSIVFLLFFLLGCSTKITHESFDIKPLKRVALVIGNKNYRSKPLKNTINDALKVKEVLDKLDFDVIYDEDISAKRFTELLEEFQSKLDSDTIAFFYFSGHANTLLPSSIESFLLMFDKKQETLVSIYKLYSYLLKAGSRTNIICLDACRSYDTNSTYSKNTKSTIRGERVNVIKYKELPVVIERYKLKKFPRNTLTVYATEVNQAAQDISMIDPSHSPFTRAFIEHLGDKEVSFTEVLRRTRIAMSKDLNASQMSSVQGGLNEYIYLNPKKANRPITVSF